jgi:hypothetical protein
MRRGWVDDAGTWTTALHWVILLFVNLKKNGANSALSSCAIPPRVAGGLWSDGVGCDACCYPFGVLCRGCG